MKWEKVADFKIRKILDNCYLRRFLDSITWVKKSLSFYGMLLVYGRLSFCFSFCFFWITWYPAQRSFCVSCLIFYVCPCLLPLLLRKYPSAGGRCCLMWFCFTLFLHSFLFTDFPHWHWILYYSVIRVHIIISSVNVISWLTHMKPYRRGEVSIMVIR